MYIYVYVYGKRCQYIYIVISVGGHEALTSRIVNKNIRIMIASCTIALVQVFRNKWA